MMKITKDTMKNFKGKAGVLHIRLGNRTLKSLQTDNVYPLYNTVKSLAKRPEGTYSKLPKGHYFVFEEGATLVN